MLQDCNNLLPRVFGPFWILQITEHTQAVAENTIANIISIDRAFQLWRQLNIHAASKRQRLVRKKTRLFLRQTSLWSREPLSMVMNSLIRRRDHQRQHKPAQGLLTKAYLSGKKRCKHSRDWHARRQLWLVNWDNALPKHATDLYRE